MVPPEWLSWGGTATLRVLTHNFCLCLLCVQEGMLEVADVQHGNLCAGHGVQIQRLQGRRPVEDHGWEVLHPPRPVLQKILEFAELEDMDVWM